MTTVTTDASQFSSLRASAAETPRDPKLLREVAGRFEALFVETLLKNMRAASLGDPLVGDNSQRELYEGMLDQQFAAQMAQGRGLGIADMLIRQLEPGSGRAPSPGESPYPVMRLPAVPGAANNQPPATAAASPAERTAAPEPAWRTPADFVRDIWPHAERVANRIGTEARAIVAQAALETGWGKHVMRDSAGRSSFNLFGIKAGAEWEGGSVRRLTLEFSDGVARRESAVFRAYDSLRTAFEDYAELITGKGRYAAALTTGGDGARFANALQDAGYATDPAYASKIQRVMDSDTMKQAEESLKPADEPPIYRESAVHTAR